MDGPGMDDHDVYDLEPAPEPFQQPGAVPSEVEDAVCKQCSYDLSGLMETGVCPECGLEIQRSLTEDYLEFSAQSYLASLHTGVILILSAIIIKLLIVLSTIALVSVAAMSQWLVVAFSIMQIGDFLASLTLAIGWWKFSSLDPAYSGRLDGAGARKTVRIATVVTAAIVIVVLPLELFSNFSSMSMTLTIITSILQWIALIAWVTGFFAAMLYLRWLSPRFPNWKAYKRAKMMMWLGPILFTVGWLCIGLGPLIAIVLYWNMLNWVRHDRVSTQSNHDAVNNPAPAWSVS